MDSQSLKKILAFLCSVPPKTNLRLALQLALAADIPLEKRNALFAQICSDRTLENLLLEAGILAQIVEADGELGEAESNMLFEAMDSIGLVVPDDLSGATLLLDDLSQRLAEELAEVDGSKTLQGSQLVWED